MTTSAVPAANAVSPSELQHLLVLQPQLRILDVRTPGEFQGNHIPGSFNVPLDTLGEHVKDLADVDHPVALICQSGGRATKAHEQLGAAGKHSLHVLTGGMGAWTAAGGDTTSTAPDRWALDRQVRLVAGLLVLLGVVVGQFVTPMIWLAGAVGFGLAFSAATNTCAMGMMLARLPYNSGPKCNIDQVLLDLNSHTA
jgi:rhodanese-related sulfurtransferase